MLSFKLIHREDNDDEKGIACLSCGNNSYADF